MFQWPLVSGALETITPLPWPSAPDRVEILCPLPRQLPRRVARRDPVFEAFDTQPCAALPTKSPSLGAIARGAIGPRSIHGSSSRRTVTNQGDLLERIGTGRRAVVKQKLT